MSFVWNQSNSYGITYWRTPRVLDFCFGRRALRIRLP